MGEIIQAEILQLAPFGRGRGPLPSRLGNFETSQRQLAPRIVFTGTRARPSKRDTLPLPARPTFLFSLGMMAPKRAPPSTTWISISVGFCTVRRSSLTALRSTRATSLRSRPKSWTRTKRRAARSSSSSQAQPTKTASWLAQARPFSSFANAGAQSWIISLSRKQRVGDELPAFVTDPISRTTLALFASASGDHNPVHIGYASTACDLRPLHLFTRA